MFSESFLQLRGEYVPFGKGERGACCLFGEEETKQSKASKVKQANRSQCGNREWVACRGVKQEGNDMLSLYVRLFSFSGERELNGLVLCSVWFLCRWAV